MLVSVEKVEQYLDGYKVSLEIGNPLSVNFDGFDIEAAWGPRYNTGDDYAKWLAAKQTKKIAETHTLPPGRWSPIDIILPSTEPKGFGYLDLKLSINRLSLAAPPR